MRAYLIHIIRFFALILIQGLVMNNLDLGMNMYPMIYILFLVLLPLETPPWLLMIIGFITGIAIDSFTSTIGMHTSALVFLAFVRPFILRLLAPREGYEYGTIPAIATMGWQWYISYIALATLSHHFWFFMVEAFDFSSLGTLLARTFLSTFLTLGLLVLIEFIMRRSPRG